MYLPCCIYVFLCSVYVFSMTYLRILCAVSACILYRIYVFSVQCLCRICTVSVCPLCRICTMSVYPFVFLFCCSILTPNAAPSLTLVLTVLFAGRSALFCLAELL